jgi:hypothetical protein
MTTACLCPLFGAFPRNKPPCTWVLEPPCWPSSMCRMFAWEDAAFMTGLTWMPGSMNIRASEGGPERRVYGP